MQVFDKSGKSVRLRRLTDDEIALWLQVARTVERRKDMALPAVSAHPATARLLAPPPEKPAPRVPTAPSYTPSLSAARSDNLPLAPLERRLKQQLLRGRSPVDLVLDLHGLRQADAHRRLQHFLHGAQGDGAKVVLVITGKGSASYLGNEYGFETGVLRRLVPHWLRAPELRHAVIGFEEAGPVHGGSGALYVRIRRHGRA